MAKRKIIKDINWNTLKIGDQIRNTMGDIHTVLDIHGRVIDLSQINNPDIYWKGATKEELEKHNIKIIQPKIRISLEEIAEKWKCDAEDIIIN